MSNKTLTSRLPIFLLILLCVAMMTTNAYLLRLNKSLQATLRATREVTGGQYVGELSGQDVAGKQITVSPSRYKSTVLLVFSPTCPYSKLNWPKWTDLVNSTTDPNVQFVLVDLTSSATSQFVAEKNIGKAKLIRKLDDSQVKALSLNATPQTIVLDSNAKVTKVFTGVLSQNDVTLLNNMIN